jgi:hypothetical protein
VPDLTGLTEDEAVATLGDQLVLGNRTGRDGRIERQVPAPGALVEPASAVTVVLDEPAPNLLWLIVPAVLVLTLTGGLVAERVRRRRVRERRWIEDQVRTDVRPQVAAVSDVPGHAVPGVDLRVEVHRDPARL